MRGSVTDRHLTHQVTTTRPRGRRSSTWANCHGTSDAKILKMSSINSESSKNWPSKDAMHSSTMRNPAMQRRPSVATRHESEETTSLSSLPVSVEFPPKLTMCRDGQRRRRWRKWRQRRRRERQRSRGGRQGPHCRGPVLSVPSIRTLVSKLTPNILVATLKLGLLKFSLFLYGMAQKMRF